MRLLLDTHIFLWAVMSSPLLKAGARKTIAAAEQVFVSSASIWEVAIKSCLGKIEADPEELLAAIDASGFIELPVSGVHAACVAQLPLRHGDPLDHILIAQSPNGWSRCVNPGATSFPPADVAPPRSAEDGVSAGVNPPLFAGTPVPVFGVAKTVADLFRYRRTVGDALAIEGLRQALRQRKATPARSRVRPKRQACVPRWSPTSWH